MFKKDGKKGKDTEKGGADKVNQTAKKPTTLPTVLSVEGDILILDDGDADEKNEAVKKK